MNRPTRVAFMRHGPTAWNAAKRLQGRADIDLTDKTVGFLKERRLPPEVDGWHALCSPLARCRQTAEALGLAARTDPRLIEMDWGEFEGRSVAQLRADIGAEFTHNEARGLDFTPPKGESPRMVRARVLPLLREIARAGRDTLCLTHRGVFRAVYSQARGWDMTGDPPDALDLYAIHVFTLDPDGQPTVEALNLSLKRRWPES
ncbi:MAG: histidine phosphatase family protein [Alphaproteobacteria bacterium]|nr:histidine phosphatase family protein [Alphaproteobacteria bacterium]